MRCVKKLATNVMLQTRPWTRLTPTIRKRKSSKKNVDRTRNEDTLHGDKMNTSSHTQNCKTCARILYEHLRHKALAIWSVRCAKLELGKLIQCPHPCPGVHRLFI